MKHYLYPSLSNTARSTIFSVMFWNQRFYIKNSLSTCISFPSEVNPKKCVKIYSPASSEYAHHSGNLNIHVLCKA